MNFDDIFEGVCFETSKNWLGFGYDPDHVVLGQSPCILYTQAWKQASAPPICTHSELK